MGSTYSTHREMRTVYKVLGYKHNGKGVMEDNIKTYLTERKCEDVDCIQSALDSLSDHYNEPLGRRTIDGWRLIVQLGDY
jgi:hypothetical protein